MTDRRVLAVAWAIALGTGIVGQCEVLALVGAYGAAITLASIAFRMMHDAPAEALSGNRRLAYLGTTGALVVVGVAGFIGSVKGATVVFDNVLDAPLAVFFVMVAVLAWRAVVVQSPGRAALVTFVTLLAYIPLGAYDALAIHGRHVGWYGDLTRAATACSLAGAALLGLVVALVFRARPGVAVPAARRL